MVMLRKVLPLILILLTLLRIVDLTSASPNPSTLKGWYYKRPIIITERSGKNLTNYQVKIELNSTNFDFSKVKNDGSDIRFTDENGNLLSYWIEEWDYANCHAIIWVKIPSIPASSSITIYMYYGNPSASPTTYSPEDVFLLYDDFESGNLNTSKWQIIRTSDMYGVQQINGRYALVVGSESDSESVALVASASKYSVPLIVEYEAQYLEITGGGMRSGLKYSNTIKYADAFFFVLDRYSSGYFEKVEGSTKTTLASDLGFTTGVWIRHAIALLDGRVLAWLNGNLIVNATHSLTYTDYYVWFGEPVTATGDYTDIAVDWVRVRAFTYPEPRIEIGHEEFVKGMKLPPESLILQHELMYSPNSTHFSHTFTTTNASTAGYETNYNDIYGWRVYANPYQSGGTNYENNASLVSEVNITLPYSEALVKNITLLARTNGTGDFRQLWIKVLDSNGNVIAELTNATISTEWTEVSLSVNANLSGQITIWINATVKSTTTTGEEIAVKDVRIYVEHETNPIVEVPISYNVDFFNCSASHYVGLGSSEYLNSSVIIFKLIEFLIYNTTDYPASPAYIGNETINSYNYMVYKIDSASYSQYLTVYALLENKLKTFRTHIRGYDTETVLVGEQLTIDLPELGNITIPELNKTFINVTSVTIKPTSEGIYTIEANLTQPTLWKIGCCAKRITVQYGTFSVKPIDVDSKVVDYESVTLQLINKSDESIIKEVTGIQTISLNNLWAGNYSIVIKFKDITIGMKDFELNITTNNSTISMPCTMKILTKDYRGLNKTIIYEYDKQVISIENLSVKYPYSRIRILLNGTGSFKLYIDYRGDLPTKVDITSNATNLKYYWDGNYLVIEGELGSSAEITVEDQYKLAIIFLDKLNNPIPSKVDINGTEYKGNSVTLYLPPATYKLSFVQFNDKGFKIANNTLAYVEINNSDKVLHVYYKVPVKFEKVEIKKTEETNTTATIMISGYLLDYYNSGVSNKTVNIIITNLGTGASTTYNTTTDVSGYFTMTIKLIKGYDYKVEISASEDDTYVLSKAYATSVSLKEVTAPARKVSLPVLLLIMIGVVIITIIAVIVVTKKVKKALMLKPRKYVKIRK